MNSQVNPDQLSPQKNSSSESLTLAGRIYQELAHSNLSSPSRENQFFQCRRFLRKEPVER